MRSFFRRKIGACLAAAVFFGAGSWAQAMEPTLTWYGHAAFKYTTAQGKVILIDPWLTNPKAPKKIELKHVEAILVTHGHFDHVGEAFDLAKKYNAPFIASYELTEIAKKHGVTQVMPINPNGSAVVGTVTITAVPAIHPSSYQEGDNNIYAGSAIGFIIQEYGAPATLYHAGDTGVFDDMALIATLYQPQIAMLPIGGVFTMGPREAGYATRLLHPRVVIPMHYGTFPALTGTPEQFKQEIARQGANALMREMVPGKEVKIKDLLQAGR